MSRSEQGLFHALEVELRAANEALDCVTLFDRPSIRAHSQTVNRVSDYLGHLWRKGLVSRVPTTVPNSKARWAYLWKKTKPEPQATPEAALTAAVFGASKVSKKQKVEIVEREGSIVIELETMTITIRPK